MRDINHSMRFLSIRIISQLFLFFFFSGKEWNEPNAKACLGQTQPVPGSVYPGPSLPGESIVKSVLSTMEKPVNLLDITLLTQLRKDGHPSIYAGEKSSDCSHWCLAGVPDAWNEILSAIVLQK